MPLPRPVPRKLSHNRVIDCRGYERDDGLWDIEGHLTDVKTETWFNRTGIPSRALKPVAEPSAHPVWTRPLRPR